MLWLILIVYYFFSDILETFLNATPNIEELHIGYSNRSALDPWTPSDYKSSILGNGADCLKMIGLHCDRLTTLSLSAFYLFEGDFFETVSTIFIHGLNLKFIYSSSLFQIFSGCPQLRNFHICGGLRYAECLNNLCRSLPQAEKLRDFR